MVLSAFLVLPVNADNYEIIKNPIETDLYVNPVYQELVVTFEVTESTVYVYKNGTLLFNTGGDYSEYKDVYYSEKINNDYTITYRLFLQSIFNNFGNGAYTISYDIWDEEYGTLWTFSYDSEYITNEYDINVDLNENIINLGTISNLRDISLSIGSQESQFYYVSDESGFQNCSVVGYDVYPNQYYNIIVDLDENSNFAQFTLTADTSGGEKTTTAKIYYDYLKPIEKIQFEIECIDYDKGIQLIGTNLTVYQYYESTNTLKYLYSNSYANGLTKITVDKNSILFIEYDLTGYNAVNINTYEFLNNRQGKLIDSNLRSARLYFSKIDSSVLLFQGFIIKDTNDNAVSGVSVTMDNNVTLISNSYGGLQFDNINQGSHTFTFTKNGYVSQSLTKSVTVSNTQNVLLQKITVTPTVIPTVYPTDNNGEPIITPIDKPKNLADSVKYSMAVIFGVNSLNTMNLIFALLIVLFPAVIGAVVTNQALGFVAGGMIGFIFALGIGLIPLWVFFSMVMISVIYLVLTRGTNEGF